MTAQAKNQPDAGSEFIISRVFDAPRERVFAAWADPEQMRHWWGPKDFKVITSKLDLRPGGVFHYCLRAPNGGDMWGKFVYRTIAAPEQLVFVNSFSDEAGNITRHPMSPGWPLELLSEISFAPQEEKTLLTVRWTPVNPTEAERQTFAMGQASMQQGWTGTLDQLAAYLART